MMLRVPFSSLVLLACLCTAGAARAQAIDPALLLGAQNPAALSALQEQLSNQVSVDVAPVLPTAPIPTPAEMSAAPRPASPAAGGGAKGVMQDYFQALTGQTLPIHGRDLFRVGAGDGVFLYNTIGSDYRLAPGDQLRVVVRGIASEDVMLPLDRDGSITLDGLLPITVSGMTIAEIRSRLVDAIRVNDSSAEVAVSLAAARLVPVQFTGFVGQPQTVALPAYTPLSIALSRVGGIAQDGSLRSVTLRTPGAETRRIDFFGLVENAPDFEDPLLTERTRVHVDGMGPAVAVMGFAPSAAIFELPPGQTAIALPELLDLASVRTLPAGAVLDVLSLDEGGRPRSRMVSDLQGTVLGAGEALRIGFRRARDLDQIEITGAVVRPETVAFTSGVRLYDLIKGGAALTRDAVFEVALISNSARNTPVRAVNLRQVLVDPGKVLLNPGDQVHVFNFAEFSGAMQDLARSALPTGQLLFDQLRTTGPAIVLLGSRPLAMINTEQPQGVYGGATLYEALGGGALLPPEAELDLALITNIDPAIQPRAISLHRMLREPDSILLTSGDRVHIFTRSEFELAIEDLARSALPTGQMLFDQLRTTRPVLVRFDTRPVALAPAGSFPTDIERLTNVLQAADLYALYANRIARTGPGKAREIVPFNPKRAWYVDIPQAFVPGAEIQLFSNAFIRSLGDRTERITKEVAVDQATQEAVIDAIDDRLIVDARLFDDLRRIAGSVQFPGAYPFTGPITLADALLTAGGDLSSADRSGVVVRQYRIDRGALTIASERRIDLDRVDPQSITLAGNFDVLVPALTNDAFIGTVQIDGEVRKPGEYAISRGETLDDLLQRAGGTTSAAYPLGAVFSRATLLATERESNRRLAEQVRQSVLALSQAERDGAADQIAAVLTYADQVARGPVTGRQVVSLGAGGEAGRILLAPGDRLVVPRRPSFVRIIGAVQSEVSAQHVEGRPAVDYLADAGGPTKLADLRRAFLVLPNGQGMQIDLARGQSQPVPPGSVIVVPPRLDRLSPLALTEVIANVMGNIATSILAFDTISNR